MAFAHTPPPAAGGSFPARTSAVARCLLPWSYHGSVFCCKGPSSSEEPLSCFLTVGTADSGSLMPGISTLCENRWGRVKRREEMVVKVNRRKGLFCWERWSVWLSQTSPNTDTQLPSVGPGFGLHQNQDDELLAVIVTVSWRLYSLWKVICVCMCVFIYVCVFTCKLTHADMYTHVCILSFS